MVFPPGRRRLETLHIRPSSSNSYNAPYAPKKPHTISLPLVPKGEQEEKEKEKEKKLYPQESHLASPYLYHKKEFDQNRTVKGRGRTKRKRRGREAIRFYFDRVRHVLKSPWRGFVAVVAVVGAEPSAVGGEE